MYYMHLITVATLARPCAIAIQNKQTEQTNKQRNSIQEKKYTKSNNKMLFSLPPPSFAQLQYPHLYGNHFTSLQTSEFIRIRHQTNTQLKSYMILCCLLMYYVCDAMRMCVAKCCILIVYLLFLRLSVRIIIIHTHIFECILDECVSKSKSKTKNDQNTTL